MIGRYFGVTASGGSVRIEIVAGATTYLTVTHIAFFNPVILVEAGIRFLRRQPQPASQVVRRRGRCVMSALAILFMLRYARI